MGREDLGLLAENEGFETMIELGVRRGYYAKRVLEKWPSCKKYYAVDIWAPLENYLDLANINQNEQNKLFLETQNRLKGYPVEYVRKLTSEAVTRFDDNSVDMIYVDARP